MTLSRAAVVGICIGARAPWRVKKDVAGAANRSGDARLRVRT
jgi:hypothetical protein